MEPGNEDSGAWDEAGNREPGNEASGDCSIHTRCTHCIHGCLTQAYCCLIITYCLYNYLNLSVEKQG